MPKHYRARTTTTTTKRRALLAAIVFAVSPMLAQSAASAVGIIARPPLPLTGTTGQQPGSANIKVNPFCMPVAVAEATPILLASGTESSNILLQPIGAAIGLHNIGEGPIERSDTPAITVEQPAASEVKTNQLMDQATDQETESSQQSSIVLLPMKRNTIAVEQPGPLSDPVVQQVIAEAVILEDDMVQPEITAVVEEPTADIETEPIFFSFSDDSDSDLNLDVPSDVPAANQLETELASGTAQSPSSNEDLGDHEAFVCEEIELVQPRSLSVVAEAKPIDAPSVDTVGSPQTNHFVAETQPVAGGVVEGPEPTLHSRRYRPPVDVHPVPIMLERSTENATKSQIDSVVVAAPTLPGQADGSKPVVTSLYMNLAQVRSLTLGAELQSVRIADKSVCQAFAAGPNQIKLIGTGNGTTRLVVYAKPSQGNPEPRVRSFEIHVKDAVEATGSPTADRSEMLNQTIQQTFPEADVYVRQSGNELIVMGRCGSEAVAKKIIRLVRRTCLVPVKDEVRVR